MCASAITFLRPKLLWLVIIFGIILPVTVSAAEFTRFRLTGYRAFMQTLMRYDENTTKNAVDTTTEKSYRTQRLLGGSTDSYIYHPNFLQMNISGSMLFDKRDYDQGDRETDDSGVAWNFASYLNFFRNKYHPFTLFFNRSNPLIYLGNSDSFNQKNTSFGLEFSLLKPFSPVTVRGSLTRDIRTGESATFQQDETLDLFTLDIEDSFFGEEFTGLSYTLSRSENQTGDRRLSIQDTESFDHSFAITNRWTLGDRAQFRLRNNANYDLSDTPDRQNFDFNTNLDWFHTQDMSSDYDYRFTWASLGRNNRGSSDGERGDSDTYTHEGRANLNLTLSERLSSLAGVRARSAETETLTAQSYGVLTRINYNRPLPVGNLSTSGGMSYDYNTQESTTPLGNIIGEDHVLPGNTFDDRVPLNNDFVAAGSVVVSSANTPFLLCTEGFEYEVIVIGNQTLIQLLDATIGCFTPTLSPDPDSPVAIEVEYSFETGGNYDFSTLSSYINANLAIASHYNFFVNFNDRRQTEHENSLSLTRQLNTTTSIEVGARVNYPLFWHITAGGEARYRHQDEEIVTIDTTTVNGYINAPLPLRSTLGLHATRSMVEISDTLDESDISRYSIRINSNPWHRLIISADMSYEEDTGATIKNSRTDANFRAEWQVRKLRLSAVAKYQDTTRGDRERERLEAWLLIRRDIW